MSLHKVLYADAAGHSFQKVYGNSHYALAGLLPAGLVSATGSIPAKIADMGLAVAIPVHSHIAMNFVVADYVPRALQVPARVGVLGMTTVMALGLLKLNFMGDGISGSVKQLWTKSARAPAGAA